MKSLLVSISLLILICSLAKFVLVQENGRICSKCFTSGPDHAYCQQNEFSPDGSLPRCDTYENLKRAGCLESEIFRPGVQYTVIDDRPLSNKTDSEEDVVQLAPQRVKLRLAPHHSHRITLQYKQVVDYPVDLYYLMDLSKSMMDDKQKLAELGKQLASKMGEITKNFSLGFGSFVDKVAMPYVNMVPEKLESPCSECAAPYGFRNHMSLTTSTEGFSDMVNSTRISGNLDAPEGGLDAIMQSIVCQNEINWRAKSRKMLVYTTDASFHYAGDGKLAGIVAPNDGKCHLDENGLYSMSTEQDYPSVSQINLKAKEHKVNIIFATTANQVPIYEKLTTLIEGSSAGKLDSDSSNIVSLVYHSYHNITSEVQLKDNATSDIEMRYFSECLGQKREETDTCRGLKVGTTVSFDIDLKVLSCPKNPNDYNQVIQVYPVGLNESLMIDLEIVCQCDCEKPERIQEHSEKCSFAGTLICGVCECDPLRYGRKCECSLKNTDPVKDLMGCYNGNETRVCSGRGACVCGECKCNERPGADGELITGKFCECDNFSCPRSDNKICGGPDHGICKCGVCECSKDWTGPACACPVSQDSCIYPKTGKVCNGHGVCDCGQCKCSKIGDRLYAGKYCEECPECPTLCEQFKDCVRCTAYESGPLTKEQCQLCTNSTFSITTVDEITVEIDETLCVFKDDDGCTYQFTYVQTPTDVGEITKIEAIKKKNCPAPLPIFLILLALALLILLLGLLALLLWKCLTMWKDRREIAKFEKEKLTAKWGTGENPIFKEATSTFKNPTYITKDK